jgi:hypothetical protein
VLIASSAVFLSAPRPTGETLASGRQHGQGRPQAVERIYPAAPSSPRLPVGGGLVDRHRGSWYPWLHGQNLPLPPLPRRDRPRCSDLLQRCLSCRARILLPVSGRDHLPTLGGRPRIAVQRLRRLGAEGRGSTIGRPPLGWRAVRPVAPGHLRLRTLRAAGREMSELADGWVLQRPRPGGGGLEKPALCPLQPRGRQRRQERCDGRAHWRSGGAPASAQVREGHPGGRYVRDTH